MKKINIKMILSMASGVILVICALAYISIIGENQQINRVIEAYFERLKDGMYLEACEGFSSQLQDGRLATEEQRMNFNFLLESSLLSHYNLTEERDYIVRLKRNKFWIPYRGDDTVHVGVLLEGRQDGRISLFPSQKGGAEFINDLIIVAREKGRWKIKGFSIDNTPLAATYNHLRSTNDLNRYISVTPDLLRFNSAVIDIKKMTSQERRLLAFSLYKIQNLLKVSPKKEQRSFISPY